MRMRNSMTKLNNHKLSQIKVMKMFNNQENNESLIIKVRTLEKEVKEGKRALLMFLT